MDRWRNTTLVLVVCLMTWQCPSVKAQNTSSTTLPPSTEDVIPVYFSEINFLKKLQYEEQNKLIHSKLLNESLISGNLSLEQTRELANGVVSYILQHQSSEDKITELSRLLLDPLGEYGSQEGDDILEIQKMSVIHDWLQHSVLGMPMLDWILNEVQSSGFNKSLEFNSLLTHEDLRRRFMSQINGKTELGLLTSKTRKYFTDNLLSQSMPSFIYQPKDPNEMKNLQLMNISESIFGHLHAGLKLLNDAEEHNISDWKMDHIIDLGIYFSSFYQENNLESSDHFELPAKIYCVSLLGYLVPRFDWGMCTDNYFRYLKESNKFMKLGELIESKKTRPQLALEELRKHDISEDRLNRYLFAGESTKELENIKGENVLLPSPDGIFEKHLKEISGASTELSKLILPIFFNSINESDRAFIEKSKVNLIDFEFVNYNYYTLGCSICIAMHHLTKEKLPRTVNILQCVQNGTQRLYALRMGNYSLHRVDNGKKGINKMAVLKLLEPGTYDKAIESSRFTMTAISSTLLKEQDESLRDMTNELAKIHGDWLLRNLWASGYEATFWQKVGDFTLSLIPFYTCFKETKYEDNSNDRAISCTMDIISFVPFVGQAAKVGYKLGSASLRASATALQSAARQVTIIQAVRKTGQKLLIEVVPAVQKAVPPQAYINLGKEFLSSVDPGIGLLRLGGKATVSLIKGASRGLRDLIPGLSRLAGSLEKQATKYQRLIDDDVFQTMTVKNLPYSNKEVSVVRIGNQKGKDIYVVIDPETNVMYGRKYVLNSKTGNLEFATLTLKEKIYQLKITGLSGDSVQVGKLWVASTVQLRRFERQQLSDAVEWADDVVVSRKAYEEANIVFRVDTRSPRDILKSYGFSPKWKTTVNYDMLQYSALIDPAYRGTVATPFVSTSSSLPKILAFLKSTYLDQSIQLELPRRISEINIRRAQAAAAPDFGIKKLREANEKRYLAETALLENPPDAYIYAIKPDNTFYHRASSYIFAGDVMPVSGESRQARYFAGTSLADQHEFLALNGIRKERIISWTPIRRDHVEVPDLKDWEKHDGYNILLNAKQNIGNQIVDVYKSNTNVYTHVGINTKEEALFTGIDIVQLVSGKTKLDVKKYTTTEQLLSVAKNSHYVNDQDIIQYLKTGQYSVRNL